jgi:hypothetical protein
MNKSDIRKMLVNPFYAITIDEVYTIPHEQTITKDLWIKSQKILIEDLGVEEYLKLLLVVLEGGFVK